MKTWGKREISEMDRQAMEAAWKVMLRWLAGGASTDDAMKGFVGCSDRVYELTVAALERDGYIERGTWGKLSVWRRK